IIWRHKSITARQIRKQPSIWSGVLAKDPATLSLRPCGKEQKPVRGDQNREYRLCLPGKLSNWRTRKLSGFTANYRHLKPRGWTGGIQNSYDNGNRYPRRSFHPCLSLKTDHKNSSGQETKSLLVGILTPMRSVSYTHLRAHETRHD